MTTGLRPRLAVVMIVTMMMAGIASAAPDRIDDQILSRFRFRNLGPFRCGSWVTSFAVPESPGRDHLYTFYVGTRNGGVWKTDNAGATFHPVFDDNPRLSIGDVAAAPSHPDIVWVGTGEAYCARSSHAGDGIYKSIDAGRTWTHMGLGDSHHIARIVIHPTDPDTVYVAVMGHLFSENPERGVFRTRDGGRTWDRVLYISEKVGAVELGMVRANPDILYAAMYDKVRLPWHYEVGGPESALYKTLDGGESWTRLEGGLPDGRIGRIGFDIFQKNPDTLYAVIENANFRPATPEETALDKRLGREPAPRTIGGEVFRTDNGGQTWLKVNAGREEAFGKAPYSFNQLRIDPHDPDTVYITAMSLISTSDGGKSWTGLTWPPDGVFQKAFGDWRTMWVDPRDRDRLIFGSDGGVYLSYDRGRTCHHCYQIPLGEFYAVGVDMEEPYNIYGGLQDHDSWKGPSVGWTGEISMTDWVTVGGGDGMFNLIDPLDSRWVINNREFGNMWRFDQKTGRQTLIKPVRGRNANPLRFNWTPPIALSPHNPRVVYAGAQLVFRSDDRGDTWSEISPDLTTNVDERQHGEGHISFCTLTTLAESPVAPGVIWSGSDDGKVQVTRDGGATWLDRTGAVAAGGGPAELWVSRVFPSPHAAGTCFVSKTGLRVDDFRPILLRTDDFGETWVPIVSNLPENNAVNAVVQDRKNPQLLMVGTEQGVFLSLNGGAKWRPLRGNMPRVKVTDLVIHPRENDLVAATYGRGLWVVDISPLQEMDEDLADKKFHLFEIEPAVEYIYGGIGNYQLQGDSHHFAPNPPNAVVIRYYIREPAIESPKITIRDGTGRILAELPGGSEPGLQTVLWNMREQTAGPAGQIRRRRGPLVEPGTYGVTLSIGGSTFGRTAVIKKRIGWAIGPFPVELKRP